MSKGSLTVAIIALIVAIVAIVLPFVMPAGVTKTDFNALKTQVANLQTQAKAAKPLNIAYLNAQSAFTVFTNAVNDLRQKALAKQQAIAALQQEFTQNKISKDAYQTKYQQLEVELLQAQINIDIGVINKMIAASGFSNMQPDLQRLKDQTQPIVDEMNKLVQTVQTGVVNQQEFQAQYAEVKNAYTQLDRLLTQAAMSKIVEAANKVAVDNGYDLVLRANNVIIYRNTARLTDITDPVKTILVDYLKPAT